MTSPGPTPRGRYFIEALGRGLDVLDGFIDGRLHQSLAEISDRLGVSKATAFRVLQTLDQAGYVTYDPLSKRYQLSLKMLALQRASVDALEFPTLARPTMERLSETLEEHVDLNMLEGTLIRSVSRINSRRSMVGTAQEGATFPAHVTSAGKVLLAALSDDEVASRYADYQFPAITERSITSLDTLLTELVEIRGLGYAIAEGELEVGLIALAVPIKVSSAHTIAALNVPTLTARADAERLRRDVLPALQAAAGEISARLGFRA